MAKVISYKLLSTELNPGTPEAEKIFLDVNIECTEENLESCIRVAKREAYDGRYSIEDSSIQEFANEPTQLDKIEAQVTYTAMMTDTLLEA